MIPGEEPFCDVFMQWRNKKWAFHSLPNARAADVSKTGLETKRGIPRVNHSHTCTSAQLRQLSSFKLCAVVNVNILPLSSGGTIYWSLRAAHTCFHWHSKYMCRSRGGGSTYVALE